MHYAQKSALLTFVFFIGMFTQDGMRAASDDRKHFDISAMCGAGSQTLLQHRPELSAFERIVYGTSLATLPGLAKELADSRTPGNRFDKRDLGADAAGALTGALFSGLLGTSVIVLVDGNGRESIGVSVSLPF